MQRCSRLHRKEKSRKSNWTIVHRLKGLFKRPEVPPFDHVKSVRVKLLFPIHEPMIQLVCFTFEHTYSRKYSKFIKMYRVHVL